jgi:hypothetical protein
VTPKRLALAGLALNGLAWLLVLSGHHLAAIIAGSLSIGLSLTSLAASHARYRAAKRRLAQLNTEHAAALAAHAEAIMKRRTAPYN